MFAPRSPAAGAYGILGLCAEELRARGLAYSAAAVTYRDPSSGRHRALASSGYDGGARLEDMSLDEVERFLIKKTLERFDGNVSKAAEALGMSRSALYRRLEKYGL